MDQFDFTTPVNMTFFSFRSLGDAPTSLFMSDGNKPTRMRLVEYTEDFFHFGPNVNLYEGVENRFQSRRFFSNQKPPNQVTNQENRYWPTGFYWFGPSNECPGEGIGEKVMHYYKETLAIYRAKKYLVVGGGEFQLWMPPLGVLAQRGWSKQCPAVIDEVDQNVEIMACVLYHEPDQGRFRFTAYPQIRKVERNSEHRSDNFYSWGGSHHCKWFCTGNGRLTNQIFGLLGPTRCRDESRWKASTLLWSIQFRKSNVPGIPCRPSSVPDWSESFSSRTALCACGVNCAVIVVGKKWRKSWELKWKSLKMDN